MRERQQREREKERKRERQKEREERERERCPTFVQSVDGDLGHRVQHSFKASMAI